MRKRHLHVKTRGYIVKGREMGSLQRTGGDVFSSNKRLRLGGWRSIATATSGNMIGVGWRSTAPFKPAIRTHLPNNTGKGLQLACQSATAAAGNTRGGRPVGCGWDGRQRLSFVRGERGRVGGCRKVRDGEYYYYTYVHR